MEKLHSELGVSIMPRRVSRPVFKALNLASCADFRVQLRELTWFWRLFVVSVGRRLSEMHFPIDLLGLEGFAVGDLTF